jgi:hypothetical protein
MTSDTCLAYFFGKVPNLPGSFRSEGLFRVRRNPQRGRSKAQFKDRHGCA